jgi:hypothetical protein
MVDSRGQQEVYRMPLKHFVKPENKEVIKNYWRRVKRMQESGCGACL